MAKKTVVKAGKGKTATAKSAAKPVAAAKGGKAASKAAVKSAAKASSKPSVSPKVKISKTVSTKSPSAKAVALKSTVAGRSTGSKTSAGPSGALKGAAGRATQSGRPTAGVQSGKQETGAARTIAAAKAAPLKKSEGPIKTMAARAKIADIVLPPGYRPAENEPFMNEMHRAYFRKRLIEWKDEILRQTRETLAILHEDSAQHADLADRATSETDRATELRTRDRQRKLIAKIDAALTRIEDGSYGYCEDTGEPIGLKRLDARPIATLSVEAQERHERREKVYREE